MKKLVLSNIALALLGSSVMANAADLTANTTVTTTVAESSAITATYTEGGPLTTEDGRFKQFGQVNVTGYKDGTQLNSISLSDQTNKANYLTFNRTDGDGFFLAIAKTNTLASVSINTQPNPASTAVFDGLINLTTSSELSSTKLVPGHYSDNITLTVTNQ